MAKSKKHPKAIEGPAIPPPFHGPAERLATPMQRLRTVLRLTELTKDEQVIDEACSRLTECFADHRLRPPFPRD